jgi:broad specificity phosphatase PhoE
MAFLKLLFVRHGQSVGNGEGRMEGSQSTPLTPLGQQQATQLGKRLAQQGWQPTHIYCSPLLRSQATLETMLVAFTAQARTPFPSQAPTINFPAILKENHQGIFNGLTWAEAQARYPDLCQTLITSLDWYPIPQAEPPSAGRQRARQFVSQLLASHHNGDWVWVISHHWILQHILAELMGCDRTWGMPMANTGVFEFWVDCDRWFSQGENQFNSELWQLKRFNDCEHYHASL